MNIKHLEFFKELAQTQHMAKAAENLGISQPTLSYAIKKIEKELGAPLFEPDGRNIRLTSLGSIYLEYITKSLSNLSQGNELIIQLMNPNKGHIKLGFTYTLGQKLVPELISKFCADKENQSITFELGQGNSKELLRGLATEKYDLVFTSYVDKIGKKTTNSIFNFIPLVQQEIVAAIPNEHVLAKKNKLYVQDLAPYPMIGFSHNSGLKPLIDQILTNAHVNPNIIYEVEEDHTMAGLVIHNLGVALMPYMPLLDQSHITLKRLINQPLTHQLYLVQKQNHFVTPSVERFEEFSRTYCAQNYINDKNSF